MGREVSDGESVRLLLEGRKREGGREGRKEGMEEPGIIEDMEE